MVVGMRLLRVMRMVEGEIPSCRRSRRWCCKRVIVMSVLRLHRGQASEKAGARTPGETFS